MIKKIRNIAIIPSRIGSKRIKKKNIKLFYSKPIIEWTFKILKKSNLFEKIIITSDDKKTLKIAKKIGFDIMLLRPNFLSNDKVGTARVIKHTIKHLDKICQFNNVCCVYPCNPFIQINDLKKSFLKLKKYKNSLIFPITNFSHPIERAYIQKNKNEIIFQNKNFYSKRTQDLEVKYYDAGQFYLASKKTWLNNKVPKKIGIKIPNWRVVDIDTLSDWRKAEILFRFIKDNKKFLKKFL